LALSVILSPSLHIALVMQPISRTVVMRRQFLALQAALSRLLLLLLLLLLRRVA
jgi:hypothetical protein